MNNGNLFKIILILFVLALALGGMLLAKGKTDPWEIINFIKEAWNIKDLLRDFGAYK